MAVRLKSEKTMVPPFVPQRFAGTCERKDEFCKWLLTTESRRFILISNRERNISAEEVFCEVGAFPYITK